MTPVAKRTTEATISRNGIATLTLLPSCGDSFDQELPEEPNHITVPANPDTFPAMSAHGEPSRAGRGQSQQRRIADHSVRNNVVTVSARVRCRRRRARCVVKSARTDGIDIAADHPTCESVIQQLAIDKF